MTASRYHPDEANDAHPAREDFRAGRNKGFVTRALKMRLARSYIAQHPGCRYADITKVSQIKHAELMRLVTAKLLRFTQARLPDGTRRSPQQWYVIPMGNPE